MKRYYMHNVFLTLVFSLALLAMQLVRAFFPAVILPRADVPNLVLVSLAALLIRQYFVPDEAGRPLRTALLAALTFGLLPYAAALVTPAEAVKLAVSGGTVFTVTAWLFDSMMDRLTSGPASKAAPLISAVGLYLASQCMMGMML